MLFALRSGMFSRDVLPSFIATLRTIVKANFSTEVVRALATFVTSFQQKGRGFYFWTNVRGEIGSTGFL